MLSIRDTVVLTGSWCTMRCCGLFIDITEASHSTKAEVIVGVVVAVLVILEIVMVDE